MKYFVKFLNSNGYDGESEECVNLGMVEDTLYEMDYLDIGDFRSRVYIKGFEKGFNSVMFNFYDEEENEIDIFSEIYDEEEEYWE